jgi:hypothetical protein
MSKDQEMLFDYYLENQPGFVEKYNGKSIILKDFQVVGVYDSDWDAAQFAMEKFPRESYIVQRVSPGIEAYTVIVASNFVLNAIA